MNNLMTNEEKLKYVSTYKFKYCNPVSKYEKIAKIGHGTFGEVFKARDRTKPGSFVAMKKIFMDNEIEGFPVTGFREIKILQKLKHDNIVRLIEVVRSAPTSADNNRAAFYLIFEFCEHDLAGLLTNKQIRFKLGEIKSILYQLLDGLFYIHLNKILHRDLKPANVLVTKEGVVKIADFGLARPFSVRDDGQENQYTSRVVTLWYRPAELLLGYRNYGPPIDMWGFGCIMAEMWTRVPILQGQSEQEQLIIISKFCGSINSEVWPGVEELDLFNAIKLPKNHRRVVDDRLRPFIKDPHAVDLLNQLLILNPNERISAEKALDHDFFWKGQMMCDLASTMTQLNQSMFNLLTQVRRADIQQKDASEENTYEERIF